LIADDHALFRAGIRVILSSRPDIEVVGEAADGEEAVALCRKMRPDLVMMDLTMPQVDGIAATRAIKAEFPRTSVLILTAYADEDLLMEAVRAGAAGYVVKDSVGPIELLDAVRGILNGESHVDQELVMKSSSQPPRPPQNSRQDLSRNARSRFSDSCPRARRTVRSPRSCTSPSQRSRSVSNVSSPSWASRTVPRPPSRPWNSASPIPGSRSRLRPKRAT
jgi:DNA-binding NarL/FixJ family response regulator